MWESEGGNFKLRGSKTLSGTLIDTCGAVTTSPIHIMVQQLCVV